MKNFNTRGQLPEEGPAAFDAVEYILLQKISSKIRC